MFFFFPWLGRIEGAEVLQLARGRTNRQRLTGRAETQCESFRTDLGLIVVRELACWFKDFFKIWMHRIDTKSKIGGGFQNVTL